MRRILVAGLLAAVAAVLSAQSGGSPPSASPDAAFLGLAVVSGVTQSHDGLTDLDGIHNAIWAATLPVTEDLQVYTRWSGTGTHTVGVKIVDRSSDTSIAETTDRIDFGDEPVTWFTHDFAATSFPSDGAYAVEVTLDGAPAAAYALFVNAEEQLPEDPAFVISVPAERGWLDPQGKAKVSGIFEYFTFPSFPARDSFSVVTVWFSGSGRFDHSVTVTDSAGSTVARSPTISLSANHGEMSVVNNSFDSIVFPSPGIYTATVFLDGARVLSYPLVIRGPATSQGSP
jgi:hypothetical protein